MSKRTVFRITLGLLAVVVLYFLYNFLVVWNYANKNHFKNADAIVVLGAAQFNGKPSEVYKARLDEALTLYRDDRAGIVIVSGGKKPGDRVTEATAGADYLIKRGVYDQNILREVSATNTWQELESIAEIAKNHNIKKVIIVSDGFHLARARAIASHFGLQPYTARATNSPIKGADAFGRILRESAALSAARIVGYNTVYEVEHKLKPATSS
jgi:uncharacterized SAM-binding protein YcdF (DUF218 family)